MTKKIVSLMLCLCIPLLPIQASGILPRGTAVPVRIISALNSGHGQGGAQAVVEYDIKDKGNKVLIRKGTPVDIQVKREKARGIGREGYIHIQCVATEATDGQTILLQGEWEEYGESRDGLALGLGIGLGLTFLPGVGLAFLAIKGTQATISPNTRIPLVFTTETYEIQ